MGKDIFFNLQLENRHGKLQRVDYHGYLLGTILTLKYKIDKKYHGLILVTGGVGDGKSSLVEGCAGLYQAMNDKKLTFDNVSWNTETFISKMDREDNREESEWWDEAIQGASGRNMAMSAIGHKLKSSIVTKRFKKHLYFMVLDRLEEYADMLIKMCDCWIHVENFALNRGRFNVFMNKTKIEYMYHLFKTEKKSWRSPEVRKVRPDCKGNFQDFQGIFLDPIEYDRRKMEETRQLNSQMIVDGQMLIAFKLHCEGKTNTEIAREIHRPRTTVGGWIQNFKDKMTAT